MWFLMQVIQFKSCIHLISPCTMDVFVIIHTQTLVNITTRVPNYKNTKWPIVALWCTTLLMWVYEDLLLVRCELKKVQFSGCVYTKTYYDSDYNWVTIWPTFRKLSRLNNTDQSKQIMWCKILNVIIHFKSDHINFCVWEIISLLYKCFLTINLILLESLCISL